MIVRMIVDVMTILMILLQTPSQMVVKNRIQRRIIVEVVAEAGVVAMAMEVV